MSSIIDVNCENRISEISRIPVSEEMLLIPGELLATN